MPRATDPASKVREIYLSLPDTKETPTWGSPHFRVGDKIFGGMGEHDDGKVSIGFKLEMEHADALVRSDPRFTRAKYVGHKGWVDMDVSAVDDWDEVKTLVGESYRLIAPKRSLAKLGAAPSAPTSRRAPAASKKAREKKAPATKKAPEQTEARANKARAKKAKAKQAPEKKAQAEKQAPKKTKTPANHKSAVARSRAKKPAGDNASR
jgi:predicted DNA-binding protein (MmcQ/YjbR family)